MDLRQIFSTRCQKKPRSEMWLGLRIKEPAVRQEPGSDVLRYLIDTIPEETQPYKMLLPVSNLARRSLLASDRRASFKKRPRSGRSSSMTTSRPEVKIISIGGQRSLTARASLRPSIEPGM